MNARRRADRVLVLAGFALVGIALALAATGQTGGFMPAYLAAFLFAGMIPIGALGPVLLLDAGGVATPCLVPLRALARLVPAASLLFVPVLVGIDALYPWERGVTADTPLAHAWLGTLPFVSRSIGYLAVWSGIALVFAGRAPGAAGSPIRRRPAALAALFLHFVLLAFASIDWMMSLAPHWDQTELGLVLALASGAAAIAAAILFGDASARRDLAPLLAAASLLWLLSQFFLFLTTWSADLPDEVTWYATRDRGLGRAVEWYAAVGGGVLPALLLALPARRMAQLAVPASCLVLAAHAAEFWWFVLPARSEALAPGWSDVLVLAGFALLLAGTLTRLAFRPATRSGGVLAAGA